MPGNPSANALNALMTATQFGQQQQDRRQDQTRQREAQGLVNTQNKIAGALAPGGAGRAQAQQLATSSGDAGIIGGLQQQLAGLDEASRARGIQDLQASAGLAMQLLTVPEPNRADWLRQRAPQLGVDPQSAIDFGLSDENIQRYVGAISALDSENFQARTAPLTLNEQQSRVDPITGQQTVNVNAPIQQGLERGAQDISRINAEAAQTRAQASAQTAATGVRSEARQLQALEQELANGQPVSQTDIRALRGEFEDEFARPFEDAQDQFLAMQNAAQDATGASDVALVFSFFKTIDPRSTVREGEFAVAANAMGLGGRIVQTLERVENGQILLPVLRQELITAAENAIRERETTVQNAQGRYTDLASRAGMDPRDVVRRTSRLEGSVHARADALGATIADLELTAREEGMTIEQVLETLEQR